MTQPQPMQQLSLDKEELLRHMPQQEPFRFVDEVLEANERHIVCRYTYRPDRDFYRGHFPGMPVTPGVILLETMAQSVVLLGIYLLLMEGSSTTEYRTMFTDSQVEWHSPVKPGETVLVSAELLAWRRRRIRSKVDLRIADGRLGASGVVAGIGVKV